MAHHARRWIAICCMVLVTSWASTSHAEPPEIRKPIEVPNTPLPALPPAVIDNGLQIGGDDIAARKIETRMTVAVMINGRGPYHFLVDSGADSSVVGLKIARDLQLPLGTPAILHATTASARVDRVVVNELALGSGVVRDVELPALREQDIGGEGMVGIDALTEQRLMIDFEKRLIKAEDAKRPAQMLDGEIVVTARRKRGQLILTEVTAAGLPVDAIVDTGSEITIGNLALRDKLIRGNRNKFAKIRAMGVTGVTVELEVAKIRDLKLGSVTVHDVLMAFADVPPFESFGLSKEPSLLLGTDLLDTFRRISLDFRARKVRFQLRKCGTSGLLVDYGPAVSYSRISSGSDASVCMR